MFQAILAQGVGVPEQANDVLTFFGLRDPPSGAPTTVVPTATSMTLVTILPSGTTSKHQYTFRRSRNYWAQGSVGRHRQVPIIMSTMDALTILLTL